MKSHCITRIALGLTVTLGTIGCQPLLLQRPGALTSAASAFTLTSAAATPAGAVRHDVPFTTVGGQVLKLDLYYPTTPTYQPLPVVVFIHGGSWQAGDKGDIQFGSDGLILKELQARGFLIASVNYRLAPGALFPAPINDVRSAITYLQREAGTINLDPQRVAAWGSSAGGHLAAMVGLTASQGGGVTLKAVVDNFGPTDLTQESLYWQGEMAMVRDWTALIGMSKKALPAWLKRY
ncbi:MAG: alpha/beta hydrolase, partial [Candidatus Sericytochromatia bacterium]|nr:alpha/beta hydrolase [Candidatus Sericytochromatia bacterium]